MATTSGNLVAGKANGGIGQRGNGNDGRSGIMTKLATGAAILGCAAALALGGLRANEGAQSSPVVSSAREDVRGQQLFLESNLHLPDGGATAPIMREQRLFLEVNTQLPEGTLPAIDRARQLFLEANTQLPDGTFGRLSIDQFRFLEANLNLPDGGAPTTNPSDRSNFR